MGWATAREVKRNDPEKCLVKFQGSPQETLKQWRGEGVTWIVGGKEGRDGEEMKAAGYA